MAASFFVNARWDAEGKCWCSESDVPGLVLQTETLEEFQDLIAHFVPDLLASNLNIREPVAIRLQASKDLTLGAA